MLTVRLECFGEIRYSTIHATGPTIAALVVGSLVNTLPNEPVVACDATDAHPVRFHSRRREAAISRPIDCRQPLHTEYSRQAVCNVALLS